MAARKSKQSASSGADGKLKQYRSMRDFKVTAEPSGERKIEPDKHLRFVVQKHAATRLHYDFRLELEGVFESWAVTKGPSLNPKDKRLAVQTEDHPLDYGDFEGTIPKGEYGGGTVMLWDRGFWAPQDKDPAKALAKGELKFVVSGEKAQFRKVETGITGSTDIEVLDGLKEGEEIVTGSYKTIRTLRNDAKVKVDNKAPAAKTES